MSIVTRGNTTFLSFTFYDEDGEVATLSSAAVQLTYPGNIGFETETVTLEANGNAWEGEWDSTAGRGGWVDFHAHGYGDTGNYAQDGRFRLTANRANLDHDTLPTSGTISDYELLP